MKLALRFAVIAVGLAWVPGVTGCFQIEIGPVLFPDGSGRLEIRIAVEKELIEMGKAAEEGGGGKNPLDDMTDPAKLQKDTEGIVCWSEGKRTEDEKWLRVSLLGYFEDIRKVKLYSDKQGKRENVLSFEYTPAGEGGTLVMRDDLFKDMKDMKEKMGPKQEEGGPSDEEARKFGEQMLEMMKPLLQDMKIGIACTVPGPITESKGLSEAKGCTTGAALDGRSILAAMGKDDAAKDALKKIEALSVPQRTVVWKTTTVTPEQRAAFKKEFDEARKTWAERLEKAKAKQAEKKPEPGKDDNDDE